MVPQQKTGLEMENQGWSLLKKKLPLDPKTMKNEGFNTPKIWVITPKNEGFGFPWYGVEIGDERKDANKSLGEKRSTIEEFSTKNDDM